MEKVGPTRFLIKHYFTQLQLIIPCEKYSKQTTPSRSHETAEIIFWLKERSPQNLIAITGASWQSETVLRCFETIYSEDSLSYLKPLTSQSTIYPFWCPAMTQTLFSLIRIRSRLMTGTCLTSFACNILSSLSWSSQSLTPPSELPIPTKFSKAYCKHENRKFCFLRLLCRGSRFWLQKSGSYP